MTTRALIAQSFSLDEGRGSAEPFLLFKSLHSYGLRSSLPALRFPSGSASVVYPHLLGCFSYILCFASKGSQQFQMNWS